MRVSLFPFTDGPAACLHKTALKLDHNTEQSLENGKTLTIMKVKLIMLVSNLKHTTWRSLVNIFYMFIFAQNDARNAVRSRSALRDCMTEQS